MKLDDLSGNSQAQSSAASAGTAGAIKPEEFFKDPFQLLRWDLISMVQYRYYTAFSQILQRHLYLCAGIAVIHGVAEKIVKDSAPKPELLRKGSHSLLLGLSIP